MPVTQFRTVRLLVGGCTVAAATSYVSNEIYFPSLPVATLSTAELTPRASPKTAGLSGQTTDAAGPSFSGQDVTAQILPQFDVVRLGGDGSIVIAGKSMPNTRVEIVTGSRVLGSTTAGPSGDFAIVVDDPLAPGGYQLTLRSTTPANVVTTSPATAVVSIPELESGQVLVLIDQPGRPSRLITVPEMASDTPATTLGEQPTAAAAPAPADPPRSLPGRAFRVAVDAVEIEGDTIFLAGIADPHRIVRGYINEYLLGEIEASSAGRFLIEAEYDLPVGEYTIRVDLLERRGADVIARAAVPFEREPGETVAAVAPTTPTAVDGVVSATRVREPPAGTEMPAALKRLDPKLKNVDQAVIIRRGDTLWRISRRVYGHGARYSTIYLANATQISDPNRIWPGQVFKVPTRTREGEAADLRAISEQATTTSALPPHRWPQRDEFQ